MAMQLIIAPSKPGRPSTYDAELAAQVCEAIGNGWLVHQIAELPGMPSAATVYRWVGDHPEFDKMYHAAMMARFDLACEELKSIAKGQPVDAVAVVDESQDGEGDGEKSEKVSVQRAIKIEGLNRSKVRIETMKWILAKRLPKVYGEPVQQVIVQAPAQAEAVAPPPVQLIPIREALERRARERAAAS